MSWEGDDRRRRITNPTQHHRRHDDLRQAFSELDDLREGLEDVKNELIAFKNLPTAIGKLDGKVDVLMDICTGIDGKTDKLSSFKSWVIAILGLLIPVAVALIGAYAILKSQAPQAVPR